MSISPLAVRPLASTEEYSVYTRLADAAFSPQPSEEGAQSWLREILQSPRFHAEQMRGAFRDERLLGGYSMHGRMLCMGAARLATGCIGAVVTAPEARKQGVATALMHDAISIAQEQQYTLLLLDGIPNFYFRYGYTDVFDVTCIEVDRSAILAQTPPPYRVRPATVDDAAALLDLYQRHCGNYTGSFERSLEFQAYTLGQMQTPPVVALSPEGKVEGYLRYRKDEIALGRELAADTWEALLALLRYHAHLLDSDSPPAILQYFLPLNAPLTHWLVDKLEVPDTAHWNHPAQEWGVRALTYQHRFTGWMARLINFPALMASIQPELQARWQRSLARWSGEIALSVAGQTCVVRLNGADVELADQPAARAFSLELTPQALLQLVFGYRPLAELAELAHLSADARSALALLFPSGHTWIPNSDWF